MTDQQSTKPSARFIADPMTAVVRYVRAACSSAKRSSGSSLGSGNYRNLGDEPGEMGDNLLDILF